MGLSETSRCDASELRGELREPERPRSSVMQQLIIPECLRLLMLSFPSLRFHLDLLLECVVKLISSHAGVSLYNTAGSSGRERRTLTFPVFSSPGVGPQHGADVTPARFLMDFPG
ncbi:hypothetical protein KOW79_022717 [Hemibagrus wyckioides]|uniref:Uncharacterized protein n=1 Tax=Hemibagrus wyckioides TaxID=337641 RepID=A0A9D3N1D7_9TELE|nr:hypothetical protein KOW79_022717 [Hemibagrus wyckioides]